MKDIFPIDEFKRILMKPFEVLYGMSNGEEFKEVEDHSSEVVNFKSGKIIDKVQNSVNYYKVMVLDGIPQINPAFSHLTFSSDSLLKDCFLVLISAYRKYGIQKIVVGSSIAARIEALFSSLRGGSVPPSMEIILRFESEELVKEVWNSLLDFVKSPSYTKSLKIMMPAFEMTTFVKMIKEMSQALAVAPSITHFILHTKQVIFLDSYLTYCSRLVRKNVFLKSFLIVFSNNLIDLCSDWNDSFNLDEKRIQEELKNVSLPNLRLAKVSTPTGNLDHGSLSRGVALFLKSNIDLAKNQYTAQCTIDRVIITDPLFLLKRPLTKAEHLFYKQVAATYRPKFWVIFTDHGLKEYASLEQLFNQRPIKNMKCMSVDHFRSKLSKTVLTHQIKVIDIATREEILRKSLNVECLYFGEKIIYMDSMVHCVDDEFKSYLQALNYEVKYLKLQKISLDFLKELPKALSKCSRLKTLSLNFGKGFSHKIWCESSILDFFTHIRERLPCLESLSIEDPPVELLKTLLQEPLNLHVIYYHINPFDDSLSLQEIKKENPSHLSIELSDQALGEATFDGLLNFVNPNIILKTLYFTRCRLSMGFISAIEKYLKTYPSQTITILFKKTFFQDDFSNIAQYQVYFTGGVSLINVNRYSRSLISLFSDLPKVQAFLHQGISVFPQVKDSTQRQTIVPTAISEKTVSLNVREPRTKKKCLIKQPIATKNLKSIDAVHFARIHVLQDIKPNASTSTWEMFNDIKQDKVLDDKDSTWLLPNEISARYDKNPSWYYGEFECTLQPGELYPLPSYETIFRLQGASLSGCDSSLIQRGYNESTGQTLISLKPEVRSFYWAKITFIAEPEPQIITSASKERCLTLPVSIMDWLMKAREKILQKKKQEPFPKLLQPFAKLIQEVSKTKKDSTKLNLIRRYCYEDKSKPTEIKVDKEIEIFIDSCLPSEIDSSKIAALKKTFQILLLQVRNCGLQVFSAVILCRFFGIPARMITGINHALLEAPKSFSQGLYWHTYELGGVEPDYEFKIEELKPLSIRKPEEKFELKFPLKIENQKKDQKEISVNSSISVPVRSVEEKKIKKNLLVRTSIYELKQDYENYQKAHSPINTLDSLKQTIASNVNPVRIILPTEIGIYELARDLRQEDQPLFIIRELSELIAAQTPSLNGQGPSPKSLAYCLQNFSKATLVINTSGFKPHELPCLNNLLDQSKREKKLKIILMHFPSQEMEATLAERTTRVNFQLKEDSSKSHTLLPYFDQAELKECKKISYSKDPMSAQMALFGQLSCSQKGWQLKTKGKIYEAITDSKLKQPIWKIKLPEEPSLRHNICKVLVEGRYTDAFHQTIDLPSDFVLYQDGFDHESVFDDKSLPLQQLMYMPEQHQQRVFYLNASTFFDFINMCTIDEKGVNYGDELLRQYQAGDIIKVTGDISYDQFREMIDFMKSRAQEEQSSVIPLCFYVEPGVNLPSELDFEVLENINIKSEESESKEEFKVKQQTLAKKPIIQTCSFEEYDALYKQDIEAKCFCCTVSPQTTYDLLNIIRLKGSGADTRLEAKTSAIIQQLRQGREVVLYGNLLPEIIECIQSLLGNPPYLKNEIFEKGRLRWVKPPSGEKKYQQPSENPDWKSANSKLSAALADDSRQFLCITGPTGSGKTHAIESYASKEQIILYRSHEVKTWLEKGGILYLDEANRSPDGTWDLLRDVVLQTELLKEGKGLGEIAYLDQIFKITEKHRVIVSQNPNDYSGCQPHHVFDYFEHLKMPEMTEAVMQQMIEARVSSKESKLILEEKNKDKEDEEEQKVKLSDTKIKIHSKNQEICTILFAARKIIKRIMPHYPFTLRDCFAILDSISNNDLNNPIAITKACVAELGFIFPDRQAQTTFIREMAAQIQVSPNQLLAFNDTDLIYLNALKKQKYFVPESRELLTIQIARLLQNHEESHGKQAIILEGPPGVGKTEVCCQLLKYFGINYVRIDASISIGQSLAVFEAKILEAFDQGQVVVIDELNLLEESQLSLLLQLLENRHPSGRPAMKPGFRLMVTQNPESFEGRNATSAAFLNRCKRLQVFDYDVQELQILASNKLSLIQEDILDKTGDDSLNKDLARCIAILFDELKNYCKKYQKIVPNYRSFFRLCELQNIKKISPGEMLGFLLKESDLSLFQEQSNLLLEQISRRLNKPEEDREIIKENISSLVVGRLPENQSFMQMPMQQRRDILKNLDEIKKYQKDQLKTYLTLLSVLTEKYANIREQEGSSTEKGTSIPFFGRGRSSQEKVSAGHVLSRFIMTASNLLHSGLSSDALITHEKAEEEKKAVGDLESLISHQDAFKSGLLKALYLAFVNTIQFNKVQLNQELKKIGENPAKNQLLPLIAKYVVSRTAKGLKYTSRSGHLNPLAYSEQQKKTASQLMWEYALGKGNINSSQQLEVKLAEQNLLQVASRGDLGLIYRTLGRCK